MICERCHGNHYVVEEGEHKPCPACVEFDNIDAIIMDRSQYYGPPEENFERMARGYEVILGLERGIITGVQVALMHDWDKTCRLVNDETHKDSWKDKVGYTRIGERLALKARPQI